MKFDFLAIYQLYPRKMGKSEGLLVCKNTIKTQADYDLLSKSVVAYRDYCVREGTEMPFIQYFSTFMNKRRWRDWIDPDVGTGVDWNRVWGNDEGTLSKADESLD